MAIVRSKTMKGNKMTAKEYLSQLWKLNIIIRQRQKQLDELRDKSKSLGSMDYGKDRVMVSIDGSPLENNVVGIVDLEAYVKGQLARYLLLKNAIIREIEKLSDARYIAVLTKRYAEMKRYKVIAREMHYTEQTTRDLHCKALKAFESEYTKLH